MMRIAIAAAALSAAISATAVENALASMDFSNAAQTLAPECRAEAGRVSLHVEDLTWNRCGKCEVSEGIPDRDHPGCSVFAANALIGFVAAERGFPVKAGTRYDVAFDAKSLGGAMGIAADVVCWTGDSYWKGRKVVKAIVPGGVKATGDWRTFKGAFRAPEGAVRAALRLSVWSSTKWKESRHYAVGDAFLFDNVRVVESKHNFEAAADDKPQIALRKTIAAGDAFDDLASFKDGHTPAAARTRFRVTKDGDALCFDVEAEEPGGVIVGKADKPWSGDTVEIVVEGREGVRTRTHIAFNNAGAKYTNAEPGGSNGDWDVKVELGEAKWTAHARLPFKFLGLQEPMEEIGFNVGRARAKAKTFDTWSPAASFHDPSGFGRLLFNGYAAALEKEFGGSFSVSTRAEFDAAWAACEEKRMAEKLARFKDAKFSVAPVSTLSDWSQPFLPEEIFDPPSNIVLKAAVNEIAALPLAVANLSGRVEDYSVVLDAEGGPIAGAFGLRGFPPENVTMRRGVRIRDVDGPSPSTRFDPLVKMDEVGTLTVPPREAGLVWCDFDCTGVKPGVYSGFLRVVPLCEEGKLSASGAAFKYTGKMQVIPVSIEVVNAEISVRPAIPAQYFMAVPSEEVFDAAFQIGAEAFQIHAWAFAFERDAAGNLDLNRPKKSALKVATTVSNHVAWAAKHGFRPKFVVVYSAMDACAGLYGCVKDPEKFRRVWPQYVRGVKKVMNDAGVPDTDYVVEVRDEPKPDTLGKVLEAHRLAKEACPTVRLMMLLAAWKPTVAQMREFVPYADVWNFWSNAYFKTDDSLSFLREIKAAGQTVRSYSCETSIRMSPLHYYRHHAWRAERHGLDGIDMYQLFDHVHGGGFGRKDFITPARGGVFYGSFGKPVPSLRYMALREGFTDCKMLAALKAKNAIANDTEIAEFLKAAAMEVIDRNPNDAELPEKMRNRARELLAMNKSLKTLAVGTAQYFKSAEPVWARGRAEEMNSSVRFKAAFDLKSQARPVLRITGSSAYRIRLNGKHVGYGPARAPKGFFRVDEWSLGEAIREGRNELEIDAAGYNCNSFYYQDQPAFLQAEVVAGGKVLVATATAGGGFAAESTERVRKVPRYSFQRTFAEAYRVGGDAPVKLALERRPAVRYLDRIASYPKFELNDRLRVVSRAKAAIDPHVKFKSARFVNTDGKDPNFKAFAMDDLEVNLWTEAQKVALSDRVPCAAETGAPFVLRGNESARIDAGLNDCGFFGMTVKVAKPGRVLFVFDEVLADGRVSPTRTTCCNCVEWMFERAGTYEVETFEPYVFRHAELVGLGGEFDISGMHVRAFKNPDAGRAAFRCSDPALEKVFEAARETFVQNAVDVFTDCPSRERAGWLCDSFFIGRVNKLLTGDTKLERLFLQNFAVSYGYEHIPAGAIPMCYPADQLNGRFIPNWAMWLVIEVEEYLERSGDRATVDALRPRLVAFVDYMKTFRNSDGLLEKLPSWVFVEWSQANKLVQDVNYPSNMTWAEVLDAMDRLYGMPELAAEAAKVRETVRRQSWTGKWFCDNAVRQADGSLKLSGECTETCQYYAFFFRTATPKTHPALWKTLVEDFGPKRLAEDRETLKRHPEIWPSNAFIGNYLRLECLAREGLAGSILDETKDFFLYMAERTGTLWEMISPTASCDHGFASHAAVYLFRDILGVKSVDAKTRKVVVEPPKGIGLEWAEGTLPVSPTEAVTIRWRRGERPMVRWGRVEAL